MKTSDNVPEYELLQITIETEYESTEDFLSRLRDDGLTSEVEPLLVCDANGIPMGTSKKEYELRQHIIETFLHKWGENNSERKVFNDALGDYIYVKAITLIEAKEHTSKRYKSTCALLILDEVLKNAKPVCRVPIKRENKNQASFVYMLVMVYRHDEIGTVKLTVGVKTNEQHVQYGITALQSGQPLIDKSLNVSAKKKKRSPRK